MTEKFGYFGKILTIIKSLFVPFLIILGLSLLILLVSSLDNESEESIEEVVLCTKECKINLVETIPENLTYPEGSPSFYSTYYAWKSMLKVPSALDLAVFYWSLRNDDVLPEKMPSSFRGEVVFRLMKSLASQGIIFRIAQNAPSKYYPQNDSQIMAGYNNTEVRSLDFDNLLGAGVLHTKMWLTKEHLYLGSANMDWRSLSQVKEVGVFIQDCPCIAEDMKKIFEVYWMLGLENSTIPDHWPKSLETKYNSQNPMNVSFSGRKSKVFVSSSPPPLNPAGRSNDLDSILGILRSAEQFIHIAVMDYFPRTLYAQNITFWPDIDLELRRAALERRVEVRLLASHWNHTREDMVRWLRSLQDLSGSSYPPVNIEVKLFVVPTYTEEQRKIPFARVNHNKYMVTDKTAYIGTSNWSADYFTNTAGVSISVSEDQTEEDGQSTNGTSFREQLESLFQRDWNSQYAKSI